MSRTAAPPLSARLLTLLIATSSLFVGCHDHGSDTLGGASGGAASDATAPTVLSLAPEAGAQDVSVDASIRVRFSESMEPSAIDKASFSVSASGAEIDGVLSFDEVADTATFTPSEPLPDGVTILAQLTTDITDLAGNGLESDFGWTFTTEDLDTEAPRVLASMPADGATDFPVGGLLSATFSEPLDPRTVTVASFMVMEGGRPLAGFVMYDPVVSQATFAPALPLPAGVLIEGTLTEGIRDLAGNGLEAAYSFSFLTEAVDATSPVVVGTVPADLVTGVSVDTVLSATFSEALDASTVSGESLLVTDAGSPLEGTVTYDPATFTATFLPSAPLPFGTTLRADILESVTDVAGNPLAGPFVWTFTTEEGDITPPTVTSVDPVDQAGAVPQNGLISATFSENVEVQTINTSTFLVSTGGAPLQGIVAYDAATLTATFAPSAPLPFNSLIAARLTSVIADPAGNRLDSPFEWSFTTVMVDDTPPEVTAISPSDLNADVPVGTAVTATFSEAVDPSTLNVDSFTLTANSVRIPAVLMYDSGTLTATLRPNAALPFGTIVRADVGSGVMDLAGNPLAALRVWTFTTELGDTTPPSVVSTRPAEGATDFSLGGRISATFSEPLDPATVNVASFSLRDAGTPLAGFVSYDASTLTAVFSPAAALPSNAVIEAVLTQGIQDLAGNAMAAPESFSFTTEAIDTTSPEILSMSPDDQGAGVSILAPVTAVFSEALDANTVSASAFTVSRAAVPVLGSVSYDPLTFTATFRPAAPFPNDTTLRVDIQPTITDLAGNALSQQEIWTFTTDVGDTTAPTVSSVDPVDLAIDVGLGGLVSATFSEDVDASTLNAGTFFITEGGAPLPGIISYDPSSFTATFAPTSPLPPNATLEGHLTTIIADVAGNALASPFQWSFSTVSVDNVAPTIVALSPGDLELGVPVNSTVSASFSEAIEPTTLSSANFTVTTGNVAVPGALSYDQGSLTATFTPNMPFEVETTLRVDVRAGITDLAGNALVADRVWTFTTELGDTTPPAVVATVPTAGISGFPVGGTIQATFSEPLDPSSVNVASFQLMDGAAPIAGFVTYSSQSLTATFRPASPLPTGSAITVLLTPGLQDVAGNALAVPFQFSFDTESIDATRPAIVATSPSDQSFDVSVASRVTASFSEALDPATVTGASFTVSDAGSAIPGVVTYDPVTFVATFTPGAPLPNATTLRADIAASVADLAGNSLAAPAVWTFATEAGDTDPPTVTSVTPPDMASGVAQGGLIAATFSEGLDATTLNAGTFLVTDGGAPLPGIVGYDAAASMATFAPSAPLPPNATIVVRLSDLISDPSGNRMAAPFEWSFTTVSVDNLPPVVTATTPADFATDVAVDAAVNATFSEAIDAATLTAASFQLTSSGLPLAGSLSYDPGSFTATFTPSLPYPSAATVRVDVDTSVTDLAGNALASSVIWTFTIEPGDVDPPEVTSVSPLDGEYEAPIGAAVAATFSEPLDPTSLDVGAFTVTAEGLAVPGFLAYDPAGATATFTPAAPFPGGVTVVARLSTAIADVAGNRLAAPFEWSFVTEFVDSTPPVVISIDPAVEELGVDPKRAIHAVFSEALNPATVHSGTVRVLANEASIAGQVSYSASSRTVTFEPDFGFQGGTEFFVSLTTGIEDVSGNTLEEDFESDFTTPFPRYAYSANALGNSITQFRIDPWAGRLENRRNAPAGLEPRAVALDPELRFVYSANSGSNDVSRYLVDPVTGELTFAGSTLTGGQGSRDLRVDPSGRFLYVVNGASADVSQFSIDPQSGSLSALAAPVPTGISPRALAVDGAGQVAYVVNEGSNDVSVFAIDAGTGVLSQVGVPVACGSEPQGVVIDPYGRFAYVANGDSDDVSAFAIDGATGALGRIGNDVAAGDGPRALDVDPTGRFLYVTSEISSDVSAFAIDSVTGALSPVGSPVPAGDGPTDVRVEPSGHFAYVSNRLGSSVTSYRIDFATGALSSMGSVRTPEGTSGLGFTPPSTVPAFASPLSVYAANSGSDDVAGLSVEAATGQLTSLGQAILSGGEPQAVAVHPSGKFTYVVNLASDDITPFLVLDTDGSLSPITAPVPASTEPSDLAIEASGRFLYVANGGSDDVTSFVIDQTTGDIVEKDTEILTGGSEPRALSTDPAGRFLFVVNGGSDDVSTFSIDPRLGTLTRIGSPVPAGDEPEDIFVHPSGRFAYVCNGGSDDVTTFAIDPATGVLTEVGTEVAAGEGPRALAVEATGRFAFVVAELSNDVTCYTIDQATGALAPSGTAIPAGIAPVDITIDHSGGFAYVASASSSSLSTFEVRPSTGALIPLGINIPGGLRPRGVAVRNRDQ